MTTVSARKRLGPFTIPNILTYGRVVAVPVVVACMFWPDEPVMRWIAFGVFALAAITDFFDGYLARIWEQQSSLGRMLDPIADKLLVAASLMMLVANHTIVGWSIWAAIVILSREILVSGLREFLAELRVSVPVSTIAKWKTTLQVAMVVALILAGDGNLWVELLVYATVAVTVISGVDVFFGVRRTVDESRRKREERLAARAGDEPDAAA